MSDASISAARPNPGRISRTATRYLCAAAYLDRDFRNNVLRWVLEQEHRAIAPSYSIDIVPIIQHCIAARGRELVRDVLISLVLLLALIISFWQVLALLAFVYAFTSLIRVLTYLQERNIPGVVVQSVIGMVMFFVALAAFARAAVGSGASSVGGALGGGLARLFLAFLVAVAGTLAVATWYRILNHRTILARLTDATFDAKDAPPAPSEHHRRLTYLRKAQSGNVTIYARSARQAPFIGCGPIQEAWSIALPLVRRADQDHDDAATLSTEDLYREMGRALTSLADPALPEADRIEGLHLEERLYVAGLLPASHPLIDEKKEPRYRVSTDEVRELSRSERNRVTRYLTLRISGWEGELDVTTFMFFSVRGQMLYFEFIGTALPEIKNAYQEIDAYRQVDAGVWFRAGLSAALETPALISRAPINLLTPVIDGLRRGTDIRSQLQSMSRRLTFDFGATGSVRAFGAEWDGNNFFHDLDSSRYLNIVQRRAVDAVKDVLDEAGYDTEEFMARANVNIDNSMTIGNIEASNATLAIGHGSRAGAPRPRSQSPARPAAAPAPGAAR